MNQLIQDILDCEYEYHECYMLVKKWKRIIRKQQEKKNAKDL